MDGNRHETSCRSRVYPTNEREDLRDRLTLRLLGRASIAPHRPRQEQKPAPKGFWASSPRLVEVTFSGGALFASVDGKEQEPLIPQSQTMFFAGNGLSYDFIRNDQGAATHVIEGHVTGDYKYERQK